MTGPMDARLASTVTSKTSNVNSLQIVAKPTEDACARQDMEEKTALHRYVAH